jgi:hypothetical protein
MNFEPTRIYDTAILNHIFKLRAETWIPLGVPPSVFPSGVGKDPHDDHAMHWAITENNTVLAAARMCIHQSLSDVPSSRFYEDLCFEADPPIASINWLVIRTDARRLGLSKKLDSIRIETAIKLGCRTVVCYCSQLSGEGRRNALVSQGFKIVSPINFSADWCPTDTVTALSLSLETV